MRKINVCVFGEKPHLGQDIITPRTGQTPTEALQECIDLVLSKDVSFIRVYNGDFINWLGSKIEGGFFFCEDVIIYCDGKSYRFDCGGVIQGQWPYGVFQPNAA